MGAGEVTRFEFGEGGSYDVPWLAYEPMRAAELLRQGMPPMPLLGWAGRLWSALARPDEARHAIRTGIGPAEFEGAVREFGIAGLGHLGDGTRPVALAIMGERVHAWVRNPCHVVRDSPDGISVEAGFPACPEALGWRVFHVDSQRDAAKFGHALALRRGVPWLGVTSAVDAAYRLPGQDVFSFAGFANALLQHAGTGRYPDGLDRDVRDMFEGRTSFGNGTVARQASALASEALMCLRHAGTSTDDLEAVLLRWDLLGYSPDRDISHAMARHAATGAFP